jgi:hypothetical protein
MQWLLAKVKENCSCCLIKYHAMQVYEGLGLQLHAFLNLALDEWQVTSRPGPFNPIKRSLGSRLKD